METKTATLIMLDKPILVNEEVTNVGDYALSPSPYYRIFQVSMFDSFIYNTKILAGHEGTKRLTFNLSEEDAKRIGYVDVEKVVKAYIDSLDWNMEDIDYEKNLQNCKYDVKEGIKLGLSLTPKKYTEEQVAILIAQILDNEMAGINLGTKDYLDIINQPQQFKVEYTETETEIELTKIL